MSSYIDAGSLTAAIDLHILLNSWVNKVKSYSCHSSLCFDVVGIVCLVLSAPAVQLKVGEEKEIAAQFIFPGDSALEPPT